MKLNLKLELLKELPGLTPSLLQEAEGKPCPYCSTPMVRGNIKLKPTRDHIRAKSRFKQRYGRTIIVCSECNFMKGTFTLEEFIVSLSLKNDILLRNVELNIERMRNIRYLLDTGLDGGRDGPE